MSTSKSVRGQSPTAAVTPEEIPRRAKCPVCGSEKVVPAIRGFDLNYLTSREQFLVNCCSDCGLGITEPELTDAELTAAYPDRYRVWHGSNEWMGTHRQRLTRLIARLSGSTRYTELFYPPMMKLEHYGPVGRVLEVGCGTGATLAIFKHAGWQVLGIEPSELAAQYARGMGIDVITSSLHDVQLPPRRFNAIILHHVLEQFQDLGPNLDKLCSTLAEDGRLYIGVPNFATPARAFFGPAWAMLDLPRHRYHFTPDSLAGLLRQHGLSVVRTQPLMDLDSVLQSLLNLYVGQRLSREAKTYSPGAINRLRSVAATILAPPLSALYGRILLNERRTTAPVFGVIAQRLSDR